jgi:hypothetical protein
MQKPALATTPPKSKSRTDILAAGIGSILRAVWFLLSIPLYLLGLALLNLGKLCISISRWESGKSSDQANNAGRAAHPPPPIPH